MGQSPATGAILSGLVPLQGGTYLYVAIGQQPDLTQGSGFLDPGGSGGTFVYGSSSSMGIDNTAMLLLIAGGGGGIEFFGQQSSGCSAAAGSSLVLGAPGSGGSNGGEA